MKEELLRLAERCETATGPDREMDEAIRAALGFDKVLLGVGDGLCATEEDYEASEFTASLDAAMTLVPEGGPFILTNADLDTLGDYTSWRVSLEESGTLPVPCATPALALCAAALRASVKEQNNGN